MPKGKHIDLKDMAERVFHRLDLPANILPWGMDMEIKNDCDIYVDGCTSISEYTKERVVFCGRRMNIVAEGREFELFTFADGRVRINGKIDKISLSREENGV